MDAPKVKPRRKWLFAVIALLLAGVVCLGFVSQRPPYKFIEKLGGQKMGCPWEGPPGSYKGDMEREYDFYAFKVEPTVVSVEMKKEIRSDWHIDIGRSPAYLKDDQHEVGFDRVKAGETHPPRTTCYIWISTEPSLISDVWDSFLRKIGVRE